jgi:hypothetical protein
MRIKMAVSKRTIGTYSIAGILVAILIIVSFVAAGVQLPINDPSGQQNNNPPGLGTLVVSVKDKPVELSELYLTITGVWIQVLSNDGDSEENNDGWTNLKLIEDKPIEFDLLSLREKSIDLSTMQLSAGEYGKIRIYVSEATAIYPDSTEEIPLKVPSGRIDVITKVTIEENMQSNLLIDLEPDATAISTSGNFRPIIKATLTITEPEVIQPPTELQSQESVSPSPSASPSPITSPSGS